MEPAADVMKVDYLKKLRDGEALSTRQLVAMIVQLSIPAIMAQISSIVMEYIDAGMVGHLGSSEAASIGLMASSTWMMGGLCMAVSIGFTVQVAQAVGAKKDVEARALVRLGLTVAALVSVVFMGIGAAIGGALPGWLGGEAAIQGDASVYFRIFAFTLPIFQINVVAGGMLQSSGNMKLPSILHIVMCVLDVVFNAFLIFPELSFAVGGFEIALPGAGLGVAGAALGTSLAELVIAALMLYFLLARSPVLHLRRGERLRFSRESLRNAVRIALPVGFEQIMMCGAQIASTVIVAPLGSASIAAHSFSITAESLCYMPGYGISVAASTLIGQSTGAKRADLTRRLGWMTMAMGMGIMTCTGALMYAFAPEMIGILTPDETIRELGIAVLRIEAFAEPMYAAAIVANGVFRGAGDTLVPSCMSFVSMWVVRLPLAAYLAPRLGLQGVWIAMCLELCFRGVVFLLRLRGSRWQKKAVVTADATDTADNATTDASESATTDAAESATTDTAESAEKGAESL